MAAAVVKEPAGSANTEISNGGTIAFLARSIMSRASMARLPPMNMPVRFTPFGPAGEDRVLHEAGHVLDGDRLV